MYYVNENGSECTEYQDFGSSKMVSTISQCEDMKSNMCAVPLLQLDRNSNCSMLI